jgi:hypothetical protein
MLSIRTSARPVVLVLSALALAACGTTVAQVPSTASSSAAPVHQADGGALPEPTESWAADGTGLCLKGRSAVQATPRLVPWLNGERIGDFHPVRVVLCDQLMREFASGSQAYGVHERRYDSGFDALVSALRLPDEPPEESACTLSLPVYQEFYLVDAEGRLLAPRFPQGTCNGPLRPVLAALHDLDGRAAEAELDYPTEHQPSDATILLDIRGAGVGCGGRWQGGIGSRPDKVDLSAFRELGSGTLRVCVMRPLQGSGEDMILGFVEGGTLGTSASDAVRSALRATGPVTTCNEEASRYALLSPTDGGRAFLVELDGCGRIDAGSFQGTAPAKVQALLAGAAGS